MHTNIYKIYGVRVDEKSALNHWINSETFKNARKSTRNKIWKTATRGDKYGNHNPAGEIEHLNEAGIEIIS